MNLKKLLDDPVPTLSVRYTSTRHAVPDIPDTHISHEMAELIKTLIDYHTKHQRISSDIVYSLPLEEHNPEASDLLLHLLHRSKSLSGGDLKARRKSLTTKYNKDSERLEMILAEIDAGNDNLEIKREGHKLANLLKRVKRLTTEEYNDTVYRLRNPPSRIARVFDSM